MGLTTRAGCLLAAGITSILCGFVLGEFDLVRAGCLGVALPLIASFVMRRSHIAISNRRSTGPIRAVSGETVSVSMSIANRSLLPTGALMFEDRLPNRVAGRARFVVAGLGSRESRTVNYSLPSMDRGRYVVGPLQLRLNDPFGLVDLTRSFRATTTFLVAPVLDPLPEGPLPRSWDSGDSTSSHSIGTNGADDAAPREYRHGDDLRKIHWRSTARTGSLMVRHEERPWQGNTYVLLDTRASAHRSGPRVDPGADPRACSSFEWAVSAAASVTDHLLRGGRDTTLIAGRTVLRPGGPGNPAVLDQLTTLTTTPDRDLAVSVEPLTLGGRERAVVAIIAGLDAETMTILNRLRPRGNGSAALAILLDSSSWQQSPGPPAWQQNAELLARSGWRVSLARQGDSVPSAWSRLLDVQASPVLGAQP
jgi:uncharacterized protein (DUF58 family)